MNIEDQTNALIASIEKSIAEEEGKLKELDFSIKLKKAKLKKIKKALCDDQSTEKAVDKNG